jgi:DNA-binding LacI/PurR family transcriptional regulator
MASGQGQRPGRSPRVTIRDVAALAGVSQTTVSHALNGKGRVDPATRNRVFAAAGELGYYPSRAARALRTKRTGAIAFVVPTFHTRAAEHLPTQAQMLTTHIYMNQATSAARAALARDHSLLLIPPLGIATELGSLDVDGGIVCDPLRDDPLVALFDQLDLPVVTIERHPGRPDDPWHVRADNEGNALLLLEHLADAGAERVAILSLDANVAWAAENTATYRTWCADRKQDPIVVAVSPHQLENSAYEMAGLLLDRPDRPDAIFASAERFSTGAMRAARERGLRIPGDLLIASGIDGWETREADPPVTAIDVRPDVQGAAAAELLIARILGEEAEAPWMTPSELHIRESTGGRSKRLIRQSDAQMPTERRRYGRCTAGARSPTSDGAGSPTSDEAGSPTS